MTRFITVGTSSGTVAINPANICYIKKEKGDKCSIKFVDNSEPVTFDVSYDIVVDAIVKNLGFTAQG
jgi:competence transcription factor ComK